MLSIDSTFTIPLHGIHICSIGVGNSPFLCDDGVAFAVGTEEGPVAGGDGVVVLSHRHRHRTGEDV